MCKTKKERFCSLDLNTLQVSLVNNKSNRIRCSRCLTKSIFGMNIISP